MASFVETKQLRYGRTVIYNNQIGMIKTISKTDSVTMQLFTDNSFLSVKKDKLKIVPHSKKDVIKYKNTYYVIINITLDVNLPTYHINYVNSEFKKSKKNIPVKSTDRNIISVDRKNQEKIVSYLKFIDRYNSAVNYLNKKTGKTFERIDYEAVDKDMDNLFNVCKLRMNQLNKILNAMKKCQELSIQIKFMQINPFNFITQDYQLISYEKAEKICKEYSLSIDFKIKLEKWSYDIFLREKNTFYLLKSLYETEMKKFCAKRQENYARFTTFIKTIIIEKNIDDSKCVTTNYLLGIEKKMSDLMMELFYKEMYDISDDKINELICAYESKKIKETNNQFSLEPEQKISVMNSVKNKLSIITGPPGTGKTEILKCINYVLYELYKKENPIVNVESNDNEDSDEDSDEDSCENSDENSDEDSDEDSCENSGEDSDEDSDEDSCENSGEDSDEFLDTFYICEDNNKYINPKTIGLLAPTGLAFVNMNRSQEAKHYNNKISGTCHRVLYHTIPNIQKHRNPKYCDCDGKCKYKIDIKLVEIDEASMLDTFAFYDLLKMCKYFNSRLILLGDVEQLASIGPGKVLQQLIDSEVFTVTKLTKIKRQNAGALVNIILKMSKQVVQESDFVDDTMMLINIENFIQNKEIHKDELEKLINENNLNKNNTKFITGFKTEKKIFNTNSLNKLIQNKFNPENMDFEYDKIQSNNKYENSFIFRIKDKIIRTENDYSTEKMRANGEEAEILDYDGSKVTIKYSGAGDAPEKIGVDELYENFILNYCVTVHKSQGSQYVNVVFFIEPEQTFTDKKSIYTAISRAKERCFVIARPDDFINLQQQSKIKVSLFMKESNNYEFPN
jgi:energy-coupling factor transporter ATP-binding protein EcfA2